MRFWTEIEAKSVEKSFAKIWQYRRFTVHVCTKDIVRTSYTQKQYQNQEIHKQEFGNNDHCLSFSRTTLKQLPTQGDLDYTITAIVIIAPIITVL